MAELKYGIDHAKVAWANWPAQFVNKQKLETLVLSLLAPLNDVEAALADMQNKRGVATAEGKQLDGVGEIVGQPRYLAGAFLLPFFGYIEQPATTGYDQARYRRMGESNENAANLISDAAYKKLINWKIIANSASGTVDDIIAAMHAIFPNAQKVKVTSSAARRVNVEVITNGEPDEMFVRNVLNFIPRIAGHTVTATVHAAT